MTENSPIKHIAVFSQPLCPHAPSSYVEGLFSSIALAHSLAPFGVSISHICRPDACPRAGSVRIDYDTLNAFNRLGIKLDSLLANNQASLSLTTEFVGWQSVNSRFHYYSGEYGIAFDGVPFQHYLASIVGSESDQYRTSVKPDDYALATVASSQGRFALPENREASILSSLEYDLFCKQEALIALLENISDALNIKRDSSQLSEQSSKQVTSSTRLEQLTFETGQTLDVDFIINCTPPSPSSDSKLKHTAEVWLPSEDISCPHQRVYPFSDGWLSIQKCGVNCLVQINSEHVIDDSRISDIVGTVLSPESGQQTALPPSARYAVPVGREYSGWQANCLNVGSAASCIDSVFDIRLKNVWIDVNRWLSCYPDRSCPSSLIALYERKAKSSHIQSEGFSQLPFCLQGQFDTDYWQNKHSASSFTTDKVALFSSVGLVNDEEEQYFLPRHWSAMMMGMGVFPRHPDVMIYKYSPEQIRDKLKKLSEFIQRAAAELPTQEQFSEQLIARLKTDKLV